MERLEVTLRAAFLTVVRLTVPDLLGLLTVLFLEAIDLSPVFVFSRPIRPDLPFYVFFQTLLAVISLLSETPGVIQVAPTLILTFS